MPFQPYNPGTSLEIDAVSRFFDPIQRAAESQRQAEQERARMFLQQRQQDQSERAAAINEHRVQLEDQRVAQGDRVARANALVEAQKLAQTNPHAAAEYLRAWGHQVDLSPIYDDGPEQAPGTAPAPRPAPQGGSPVPDGAEFGQAPQNAPQGLPGMPGMGPMDGGAMGAHQGRQPQANSPPIQGLPTAEGNLSPADIEAGRQTAMAIPSEAQAPPAQRKILGYRLSAGGQTLFDPMEARQQAQALREQQAQQAAGVFGDPALDRMYGSLLTQGVAPKDAFAQVRELAADGNKQKWEREKLDITEKGATKRAYIGASNKPEQPSGAVYGQGGAKLGNVEPKLAGDANSTITATRQLDAMLSGLEKSYGQGVLINPLGDEYANRKTLTAQARVAFKEAAKLGALSGPDMGLVDDAIGGGLTGDQSIAKIRAARQYLANSAAASLDSKGLNGQQVMSQALGQAPAAPPANPKVAAHKAGKERDAKGVAALKGGPTQVKFMNGKRWGLINGEWMVEE